MNLTKLRVFQALARERSFSRAAQQLGISQPSVTTQIKSLQQEYGVLMFRRSGQAIELSSFGRELLPIVGRLFGVLDDIEASLQNPDQLNHGHLSIGLSEPDSGMEIVSTFIRRNPLVHVNAKMANSTELLVLLSECRIDVAILNSTDLDPRFYSVLNKANHLSVLIRANHAWARQESVHVNDLDKEPLLVRESGSSSRQHLEQVTTSAGIALRIVLEFNSREGIKYAVAADLGVGVVYAANMNQDESLVTRPIVGGQVSAGQYIVSLPEYRDSRTVQAFMDAARSGASNDDAVR